MCVYQANLNECSVECWCHSSIMTPWFFPLFFLLWWFSCLYFFLRGFILHSFAFLWVSHFSFSMPAFMISIIHCSLVMKVQIASGGSGWPTFFRKRVRSECLNVCWMPKGRSRSQVLWSQVSWCFSGQMLLQERPHNHEHYSLQFRQSYLNAGFIVRWNPIIT